MSSPAAREALFDDRDLGASIDAHTPIARPAEALDPAGGTLRERIEALALGESGERIAIFVDGGLDAEAFTAAELARLHDRSSNDAPTAAASLAVADLIRRLPAAEVQVHRLSEIRDLRVVEGEGARLALWAGQMNGSQDLRFEPVSPGSSPGGRLLLVVPAGSGASILGRNGLVVAASDDSDRRRSGIRADLRVRLDDRGSRKSASADLSAAQAALEALSGLRHLATSLSLPELESTTYRALLLHSAVDAGEEGPEWSGHGELSLASAAELLLDAADGGALVAELELHQEQRYRLRFALRGDETPRVALAWNDTGLVSSLDLRARVGETAVYPWVLDEQAPDAPARRSLDRRSNLQRLDVPAELVSRGESFEVTISHIGGVAPRSFTVIVSGADLLDPPETLEPEKFEVDESERESRDRKNEHGSDERQAQRGGEKSGAGDVFFQPTITTGQVALFTGASSYSFPIELPPGIGGLGVPLNLTYNSDLASAKNSSDQSDGGWVGLGWTLDVGRVELTGGVSGDHRVSLGGESEVLSYREAEGQSCSDTDGWVCEQQILQKLNTEEARFWRIEKTSRRWRKDVCTCSSGGCGAPPFPEVAGWIRDDSKIQIWNKSGVRYDFGVESFDNLPWNDWAHAGAGGSSRLYHLKFKDGVGLDHKEAWFRGWGLEKVVDTHGNTIDIDWRSWGSERWNHNCSGLPKEGWKETYPHWIRYTTNPSAGDDHAEWRVQFEMSEKSFDTLEDYSIAQSGVKLDGIKVWFYPATGGAVLVREYRFEYDVDWDDAKKSYRLRRIRQYGKGGVGGGEQLPVVEMSYATRTVMTNGASQTRYFLDSVTQRGATVDWTYQDHNAHDYRKQIVQAKSVDPGIGLVESNTYTYHDAKIKTDEDDGTERLIGFRQVNEVFGNRRQVTRFHAANEDDEHPLNGKKESFLIEHLNGDNRTKTSWTWQADERYRPGSSTNAGWFVRLTETLEQMWDEGGFEHSKKTTFRHDFDEVADPNIDPYYGNIVLTQDFDSAAATVPYRSVGTPHIANTSAWIVDKAQETAIYEGVDDPANLVDLTTYIWQPGSAPVIGAVDDRGLLQAVRRYSWTSSGVAQTVDTRYGYDVFGNRTSQKTFNSYGSPSAYATASPREILISWDGDHHAFQTRVVNPLGHIQDSYYYDVREASAGGDGLPGQVQAVKDTSNGDWVEASSYDAHGRPSHSWRGGSNWWDTSKAHSMSLYDDVDRMVEQRLRDDDGTGPSHYLHDWIFYDGLGRVIQTQKKSGSTSKEIVNTRYDAYGRIGSVTVSRSVGWGDGLFNSAEWNDSTLPATSYTYDVLDRQQLRIHPSGAERQTIYWGPWGDIATIDELDKRKVHHQFDTRGRNYRTYERSELNGTMFYTDRTFDLMGRMTSIEDHENNVVTFTYDSLGRLLSEDDPDRGLTTYEYDAVGNLLEEENDAGDRVCFWYDALDRPIGKQLRGSECPQTMPGSAMRYLYDGGTNRVGRLWQKVNGEATIVYYYDDLGRVTRKDFNILGAPQVYMTFLEYDELDRATSLTYPDGRVATYSYDSHTGRPFGLEIDGLDYVTSALFNGRGQRNTINFGNGLRTRYEYHDASSDFRPKTIRTGTFLDADRDEFFRYWWDDAGNLTKIRDYRGATSSSNGTFQEQRFEYDFLDRLTRAYTSNHSTGSYDLTYDYSPIGNLLQVTDGATTTTFGYGSRPHAKQDVNGVPRMWYDAAGRMKRRKVGSTDHYYGWNADGTLRSATGGGESLTFKRDIDGDLVKKIDGDVTTYYIDAHFEVQVSPSSGGGCCSGPTKAICPETICLGIDWRPGSNPLGLSPLGLKSGQEIETRSYFTFDGQRMVMLRTLPGGGVQERYLHPDYLGSTALVTSTSGSVLQRLRTRPFGAERWRLGDETDRGFAGERSHDGMADVYEMGVRFYDPHYRQWLSPDSIIPDDQRPQTLNRYAYVENDPINLVDPSGFLSDDDIADYFGINSKEDFAATYGQAFADQIWETSATWGDVFVFDCAECDGGSAQVMLLLRETSTDSEVFRGVFWGINGKVGTYDFGGSEALDSTLRSATIVGLDVAKTDFYEGNYGAIPTKSYDTAYAGTWHDYSVIRPTVDVISTALSAGASRLARFGSRLLGVTQVADDVLDIDSPLNEPYHATYPVIRGPGRWGYLYYNTNSLRDPEGLYE